MSTPNNELPTPAEFETPFTETYFEALKKLPLNRFLYEVFFGTEEQRQSASPASTS
jgi:hypothetical protein